MQLSWFFAAALSAAAGASAQAQVQTPMAPPRIAPLPPAPDADAEGNPFIGFGYLCKASAGDNEFALSASMQVNPDGGLGWVNAQSAMLDANPEQVAKTEEEAKSVGYFMGALRWKLLLSSLAGTTAWTGPYLKPSDGWISFQLSPERILPKKRMAIVFGHREYFGFGPSLVSEGAVEDGKAKFSMSAAEFLAFDGGYWMVSTWPYDGLNTKLRNKFGYGWIKLDRVRQTLDNVDPLNRKFREMLSDYRNLCDPVPYFQDRSIVI